VTTSLEGSISVPVVHHSPDGKEYQFTPISLSSWTEFCEWIRSERRQSIIEMGTDISTEERRTLIGEFIRNPIDMDEMLAEASTFGGMQWLMWHSVSKHHPEVDRDVVMDLFRDVEDMGEVFGRIAGMPSGEKEEDSEGKSTVPT
jgi:hypothetical protein